MEQGSSKSRQLEHYDRYIPVVVVFSLGAIALSVWCVSSNLDPPPQKPRTQWTAYDEAEFYRHARGYSESRYTYCLKKAESGSKGWVKCVIGKYGYDHVLCKAGVGCKQDPSMRVSK